jgi:hypothetical protein
MRRPVLVLAFGYDHATDEQTVDVMLLPDAQDCLAHVVNRLLQVVDVEVGADLPSRDGSTSTSPFAPCVNASSITTPSLIPYSENRTATTSTASGAHVTASSNQWPVMTSAVMAAPPRR